MPELKFEVPADADRAKCRACGAAIAFIVTAKGKRMPVDLDGTSHFATCSDPKRFRKKDRALAKGAR